MKIALGSDHAGYDLKMTIKAHLEANDYEVNDVGVHDNERSDYPVYGNKAAKEVAKGAADFAIVCCGTGVGIAVAAVSLIPLACHGNTIMPMLSLWVAAL